MNQELLDDEDNKQLIDICKNLLGELETLIEKHKKETHRKGLNHDTKTNDSGETQSNHNVSQFTKKMRESINQAMVIN